MPTPSVRLVSAGVWALLDAHPHLQAFRNIATSPDIDPDSGLLTRGYAVFHSGGGNDQPNNLAIEAGQLLWQGQVSCVGQDDHQLGWVIDTVRDLLTGRTLTIPGHRVGRLQPPLGYQAPPPRPVFTDSTERLMVPLQYCVLATA